MVVKVRDPVYSDGRIQVEEIAQALGISNRSVSTRYQPGGSPNPLALNKWQTEQSRPVSSALSKCFRSKDDFLLRLVTVDETWGQYYEQENKAPSR